MEAGLTAKQSGGAIIRHRPHLGRKGKDLIKNRKGHIGGGNPKKQPKRNNNNNNNNKETIAANRTTTTSSGQPQTSQPSYLLVAGMTVLLVLSMAMYLYGRGKGNPI